MLRKHAAVSAWLRSEGSLRRLPLMRGTIRGYKSYETAMSLNATSAPAAAARRNCAGN